MKILQRILIYCLEFIVIFLTIIFFQYNLKSQYDDLLTASNFQYKIYQNWRYREFILQSDSPDLEIWDLLNTPDSTIWVVTNKGFAYFDNYKWIFKTKDLPNVKWKPSLYFNQFNIVTGDKDQLYFIENNRLLMINKHQKIQIPLTYNSYELILDDITKYNKYLVILAKTVKDNTFNLFLLDKDFKPKKIQLPADLDYSSKLDLFKSNDESLWLNTNKGIYKFDSGSWFKIFPSKNLIEINKIIKFQNDDLLFINYPLAYQGIWKYNKLLSRIDSNSLGFKTFDNFRDVFLFSVLLNGQAIIYNNSCTILDRLPRYIKSAKKIIFDNEGNLWTFRGNTITKTLISSLWHYWDFQNDFNSGFINEIIKSKDGFIWIATGSGVEKLYQGKLIKSWTKIGDKKKTVVTSIIEDKFGRKWIGSGSDFSNVYFLNKNDEWKKLEIIPNNENIFVHKIRKDSKERLWFLTLSHSPDFEGYGAICYDFKSLTFWNQKKGLLSNRIYDFLEDSTGAYWFATNNGLFRFKNNKWTCWNEKNGLNSNKVFTLELHPDGKTVFFSNYTFGGFGYISNDSVFFKYNTNLIDKIIAQDFVFDNYGRLWISSYDGLYCDCGNFIIKITEDEGLLNDRIWPLYIDEDHLYIGTTGSWVNILHYSYHEHMPPKIDFSLNLFDNDLTINLNIFSYKSYFDSKSYYIKYKQNNGQWSKWLKNSTIHLDNLEPGIHNFKFKVMNPLGIIYDKEYDFKIDIDLPYYHQIGFLIPLFLLILLIIVLIIYFLYKRQIYIKRLEKVNENLKRSEQLYKSVFDKASDAILINRNGRIQYWNEQIKKMSGYNDDELNNANLLNFIVEEHKGIVTELQRAIILNRSFPERFEIQFIKKDGSFNWIDIRVVLLNKTDDYYETLIFITDIDIKKQYEINLKKALNKESELSEMKSSIISTISHEYRTPLTIVQTSVDLLKLYYKSRDDNKFQKYIERITLSIDRMIAFLEDIMFLGKLESKFYEINLENLELQLFCHDVINNVLANNNSQTKIQNEIKEKFFFKTDRTLLHTILYRVLDNAIKHSGNDSKIILQLKNNDDSIEFTISDNGKGIEPKKLDKIYDPFHRINEGEKKNGTGFGLTIVKACVEILNGEINISSKLNEGTKVTIKLSKT